MPNTIQCLPGRQVLNYYTCLRFLKRNWRSLLLPVIIASFGLFSLNSAAIAHGPSSSPGHHKKPVTPPPAPPPKTVNLSAFGAVGNGSTDNTAAIRRAMAAAGKGGTVIIPPGSFAFSEVIVVNNVNLAGTANFTSRLIPTNVNNSALELTGNASLSNFSLAEAYNSQTNGNTPASSGIWIEGATGAITNVSVNCNICYIHQAKNFKISNLWVGNILNIGITIVGCENLTIDKSTVSPEWGPTMSIAGGVSGLTVSNTQLNGGKAVSCSGSMTNCSFINNVFNTNGLTIPLPSIAQTISNLTIKGNDFYNSAPAISIIGYPGISTVSNLTISGNTASINAAYSTWGICLENVLSCTVTGNKFSNYYLPGVSLFGCLNAQVTGNSFVKLGSEAIYATFSDVFPKVSPSLTIANNNMANCCTGYGGGGIIYVGAPLPNQPIAKVSILDNADTGPANQASYYIYCLCPGAKVSGNTIAASPPPPNNLVP